MVLFFLLTRSFMSFGLQSLELWHCFGSGVVGLAGLMRRKLSRM